MVAGSRGVGHLLIFYFMFSKGESLHRAPFSKDLKAWMPLMVSGVHLRALLMLTRGEAS